MTLGAGPYHLAYDTFLSVAGGVPAMEAELVAEALINAHIDSEHMLCEMILSDSDKQKILDHFMAPESGWDPSYLEGLETNGNWIWEGGDKAAGITFGFDKKNKPEEEVVLDRNAIEDLRGWLYGIPGIPPGAATAIIDGVLRYKRSAFYLKEYDRVKLAERHYTNAISAQKARQDFNNGKNRHSSTGEIMKGKFENQFGDNHETPRPRRSFGSFSSNNGLVQ